jgi:hypothetical protein
MRLYTFNRLYGAPWDELHAYRVTDALSNVSPGRVIRDGRAWLAVTDAMENDALDAWRANGYRGRPLFEAPAFETRRDAAHALAMHATGDARYLYYRTSS